MAKINNALVYELASADVVFEEFDGDLVVLNLASGQYFGLNESGTIFWQAIAQSCAMSAIAKHLKRPQDLDAFAAQMQEMNLISPRDQSAVVPPALADELRKCTDAPTIACFDDLADLIFADPIHDVDPQAGWPKRPGDAWTQCPSKQVR